MSDFFEKMKDGFNRGVAAVSAGSKHMIEKTKLNVAIKNLEDDKKRAISNLGNSVYNHYTEKGEVDIPCADISEICREIVVIDEQIRINKKKIEMLEEDMNQAKNSDASSEVEEEKTELKCQCGYINPHEANFCLKCGNELK